MFATLVGVMLMIASSSATILLLAEEPNGQNTIYAQIQIQPRIPDQTQAPDNFSDRSEINDVDESARRANIYDTTKLLITFVLGIVSVMIARRWEIKYLQPKIEIRKHVVTKRIHLKDQDGQYVAFWANRITVINNGRTGAKDCKAYIEIDNNIERVGWMLPDSNIPYSVTLNVGIPEYVDLCAVEACGRRIRVVTTEHGYGKETIKSCRPFDRPDGQVITIRVASSNAKPAIRKIRLRQAPIADVQNLGRIVEFA